MSNVQDWSTTAASNNSAAPNGFPEGMAPSGLNDSSREVMAAVKRMYLDINGSLTSAGTSNAYTLTSNSSLSAYSDGDVFMFEANHTNTGAATLNVDSVGAQAIVLSDGNALIGGEIQSGGRYLVSYDAGGTQWLLLSSTPLNPYEIKYKTADQSESTAVEQDDDHLTGFAIAAGGRYIVDGYLRFNTTSLGTDISLQFVSSEAVQPSRITGIAGDLEGNFDSDYSATTGTTTWGDMVFTGLNDAGMCWVHLKGDIEGNASLDCTVKLTWGREGASGTTTLYEGSWIKITRIA